MDQPLHNLLHPSFPSPGSSEEELVAFVLAHADPSLLFHGICELPLLTEAGAALLCADTESLINTAARGGGVGSMHGYGVDLAPHDSKHLLLALGKALEPIFNLLYTHGHVLPAAAYQPTHAATLDLFSAHCIGYGVGPTREKALAEHRDQSLVTATICMGRGQFEGTALTFTGREVLAWERLAKDQRKQSRAEGSAAESLKLSVKPSVGKALLHFGRQRHQTMPVSTTQGGLLLRHRAPARTPAPHTLSHCPRHPPTTARTCGWSDCQWGEILLGAVVACYGG